MKSVQRCGILQNLKSFRTWCFDPSLQIGTSICLRIRYGCFQRASIDGIGMKWNGVKCSDGFEVGYKKSWNGEEWRKGERIDCFSCCCCFWLWNSNWMDMRVFIWSWMSWWACSEMMIWCGVGTWNWLSTSIASALPILISMKSHPFWKIALYSCRNSFWAISLFVTNISKSSLNVQRLEINSVGPIINHHRSHEKPLQNTCHVHYKSALFMEER